jgi:hypothetical protein
MINKKSFYPKIFQKFINWLTKISKQCRKTAKTNRRIFEQLQLTFIYFFAVVVLTYTIRNSLGYFPEMLFRLFPFLVPIFDIQALKILAAPEKTFILYMLIIEMFLNRSFFNFSVLVKFNVLLIFILEMLQNLLVSYWDILFNRELDVLNGGVVIARTATMFFYFFLFLFFFILYLYSYISSLTGSFPKLPGVLKKITDSVAFWLQLKLLKNKGNKRKNGD